MDEVREILGNFHNEILELRATYQGIEHGKRLKKLYDKYLALLTTYANNKAVEARIDELQKADFYTPLNLRQSANVAKRIAALKGKNENGD